MPKIRFLFFITIYITFLVFVLNYLNVNTFGKVKTYIWGQDNFHNKTLNSSKSVNIWGKASIAYYLWTHVLKGQLKEIDNGFLKLGTLNAKGIEFVFRSGPGYIQTTLPQNVSNLVLVLNGRTNESVSNAKTWLDYLQHLAYLRKTALVLLGNEKCENNWILPYMRSRGGLVDILFIVYDSPLVDQKEIFQWPLGVAVYRGFSNVEPWSVNKKANRPYTCNFVGTIYKNSSRQALHNILKGNSFNPNCYVATRSEWTPNESKNSMNQYINALINSDLTLNPVGKNTECYRLYEAMSFGSIPVVEDIMTPGNCQSPLRLMKAYRAPIIYIKQWQDLENILKNERNLNNSVLIKRRENLVQWYSKFKEDLADHFLEVINTNFFPLSVTD